ncbi:hypothetical protein C9374_002356 [Naegleria lovaniensis]|uniref:RWP-RK domain-containing protein n=1 Tax=Naegleria lovaniensis TaxID=51637 RepID=A0AA88GT91_NAELO|nr:uncharacterized protein C9374_002356 [Naegleria lovaniensis]KAG2386612.1 hypothetical protein C9374_002356 [Naegleria lovaniensis]
MPPTPKKKPTLDEISQRFYLPLQKAADDMGICQTLLKKFCRQYGISRWPYRRIRSILLKENDTIDEETFKLRVAEFIRNNSDIIYSSEKEIETSDFSLASIQNHQEPSSNIAHPLNTEYISFPTSHTNINLSVQQPFPLHTDSSAMNWTSTSSPPPNIQHHVQPVEQPQMKICCSPLRASTSTTQFSNVAGDIFSAFSGSNSQNYFNSDHALHSSSNLTLARPKLMKANSHNSISFSNHQDQQSMHSRPLIGFSMENPSCQLHQIPIPPQNQPVYSQVSSNSISTCSSSSSLSDLSTSFSNVEVDQESALLRRTSQNATKPPPLKKSSSLTAVMQPKRIQKKKESSAISTCAGNVQNLVQNVTTSLTTNASTFLTSSTQFTNCNEQSGLHHQPHVENFPSSTSLHIARPVFVKSKSQGHLAIQPKLLPSLNELFGEKFVEETKPHSNLSTTYIHPCHER